MLLIVLLFELTGAVLSIVYKDEVIIDSVTFEEYLTKNWHI